MPVPLTAPITKISSGQPHQPDVSSNYDGDLTAVVAIRSDVQQALLEEV
jgi:hypothetical protein